MSLTSENRMSRSDKRLLPYKNSSGCLFKARTVITSSAFLNNTDNSLAATRDGHVAKVTAANECRYCVKAAYDEIRVWVMRNSADEWHVDAKPTRAVTLRMLVTSRLHQAAILGIPRIARRGLAAQMCGTQHDPLKRRWLLAIFLMSNIQMPLVTPEDASVHNMFVTV